MARIAGVRRGAGLVDTRNVLIQDELTGLKPGSRVRWGMVTRGEPQTLGKATVELRQKDARLTLEILSPQGPTWQVIDTATPRNDWDSPNRGTRMIALEAVAGESGELVLAVLAKPGAGTESAGHEIKLRPLDAWSSQ